MKLEAYIFNVDPKLKFNSLTSIYDLDDYYILKAKTSDKCTPMAQNKKSHEMTTIALK